jgi:hypothetical protein
MNQITQEEPRQDVAVNTSLVPSSLVASLMDFLGRYIVDPTIPAERMEFVLRELRELRAEWAQQEYDHALSLVQAEMQPVVRNATNKQTNSKYAQLAAIDEAIRPIYAKHGFALSFCPAKPEWGGEVRLVCECSHTGGHRKLIPLEAGLDMRGAQGTINKTAMHGLGSTMSYLRRFLTCLVFHVAQTDDDDDGNAGGGSVQRGSRSNEPPPPPPRKLKDVLADLSARMSEAPDRAAIETIIAEPEVQRLRANVTKEPGASALAEVLAKGRARFPVPKDAELPAFSGFVIDAYGEIISEEIREPVRFAHAVVDAWRSAPDPTAANAVIEHNADAIADARNIGAAALVLLELKPREASTEQHDPRDDAPPYQPAVIEPPMERGKPFWPGWVAAFKRALEDVPVANLAAWAQAQREVIVRAPSAQRLLVVRAIDLAFSPHDTPAWVADLLHAAPPTNSSAPPPTNGAGQTQAASGVSFTADEHWVEETISTLKLIETRAAFDRLCSDDGTRSRMKRLGNDTERRPLFEKADAAFGIAHRRLPAADPQ